MAIMKYMWLVHGFEIINWWNHSCSTSDSLASGRSAGISSGESTVPQPVLSKFTMFGASMDFIRFGAINLVLNLDVGPKIMQDQFRIKFQPLHRISHRQCLHGVHVRVGPLEWPYKVCTPHSWCLVMRVDLATQPCKSAIKGIPRNPDLEDLFSFFDLGETKVNPFRFCF